MNAAPTTISEHVFININFLYFLLNKSARGFQRKPFESSKNLDEMHFFWGFSNSSADPGVAGTLQPSAIRYRNRANLIRTGEVGSLLADHVRINGGCRLLPSQCLSPH